MQRQIALRYCHMSQLVPTNNTIVHYKKAITRSSFQSVLLLQYRAI